MSEINKASDTVKMFDDGSRLSQHGLIATAMIRQSLVNVLMDCEDMDVNELRTLEACVKAMIGDIFCKEIHRR